MSPTSANGSAVSAITLFTTSSKFSIDLIIFPFSSAGRRAMESLCQSGYEWRFALNSAPVCGCPANQLCSGQTSCNITPQAQQQWQVLQFPASACSPELTAAPLSNANSSVNITLPSLRPLSSTTSLSIILGLALGLGLPVFGAACAGTAYMVYHKRGSRQGNGKIVYPRKVFPDSELHGSNNTGNVPNVDMFSAESGWTGAHISSSLAFPSANTAILVSDQSLVTLPAQVKNLSADKLQVADLQIALWNDLEEEEPESQQAAAVLISDAQNSSADVLPVNKDLAMLTIAESVSEPNILLSLMEHAQSAVLSVTESADNCSPWREQNSEVK